MLLLAFALCLLPQDPLPQGPEAEPARAAGPQESGPKKKDPEAVRFRTGIETVYNTNILRLSEAQIDELEGGTRPDKYRIEEPDDFILSPWAEAAIPFHLFEEPGEAGLAVRMNAYARNSVSNYPELSAFGRQGVVDVEYTFAPDVYRREYRNLDTGEFESAFYDEHQGEAGLRLRPWDLVRLRPRAGFRLRDYDSPFNHRDAVEYQLGFRFLFELAKGVDLRTGYEFDLQDAAASSTQPDTSYLQHVLEIGLEWKVLDGVTIDTRYEYQNREYTTDNDPAVDPSHRDRTDDRHYFTLGAGWKVSPAVSLDAEFKLSRILSDTPSDPGATDEETDWDREEYMLGVRVAF